MKHKAKPLVVRREKIRKALEWLKKHNPGYQDVQIDHQAISEYPDCDVLPYHIEHIMDGDKNALDSLTARYDNPLPSTTQTPPFTAPNCEFNTSAIHQNVDATQEEPTLCPAMPNTTADTPGQLDNIHSAEREHGHPDETIFESVVVTDVDGNATSNQLCAAAMRHIKQKKRKLR